jgi:hypothetical protein
MCSVIGCAFARSLAAILQLTEMCTVTFIPRDRGFLLGMNRDERWERGRDSVPPQIQGNSIYPRDVEGGTWIAVNAGGMAFAILNRNGKGITKTRSRGEVILQLISCNRMLEVESRLHSLELTGTLPFTLLVISKSEKQLSEHVWDGKKLVGNQYGWTARHWFSSGLSDQTATEHRSEAVKATSEERDYGSPEWMRRLHCAHGDAPGPFSICVHREAVGSVSYTEIDVGSGRVSMSYSAGSPCKQLPLTRLSLPTNPLVTSR